MDKPRSCGCKGCRTCLICEEKYGITNNCGIKLKDDAYVYCPICNQAWQGVTPNVNNCNTHSNHNNLPSIDFPGVYIKLDFLTEEEERRLLTGIDGVPWDLSQSGRRKQNYGPKCNFKKKKLKLGMFKGFPSFSQFVQDKFKNEPLLQDFQTIEQCSLEYDPIRGASIDPHIDDCWIWGERIITVNLLSDSVLTMTRNTNLLKYNLDCVSSYPRILNKNGQFNSSSESYEFETNSDVNGCIVKIPMPSRSLLVMYGSARYDWEHQVLREDIKQRRVCLAYREFTPPYLTNGSKYNEGQVIINNASNFY